MTLDRRSALIGALSAAAFIATAPAGLAAELTKPFKPLWGPRSRVLFVNDLSGDVDGLFAAVHTILSPSTELRGIIGTATGIRTETAERSAALADEMLRLMGMAGRTTVYVGAASRIGAEGKPVPSPGTRAIIAEAMRTDTKLPLYVAVGGGLTEVASAVMIEPRIAERFTLVWIGGDALPDGGTGETNFNIDRIAAQFLFNDTHVRIWQIPRSVYRTCVVSATELQAFVAPYGAIGPWLQDKLFDVTRKYGRGFNTGETWTLGDNPLVVLTSLADWAPSAARPTLLFEQTGSSLYDEVTAPHLNADGTFATRSEGRRIRVYRSVDTRMMMSDFYAKMRVNFAR